MDGMFGGATGATGGSMGTAGAMSFEYVAFGPEAAVDASKMEVEPFGFPGAESTATDIGPVGAVETLVSPDTLAAYRRDMAGFTAWCSTRGERAVPARADAVLAFLSDLLRAGRKWKGVLRVGTALNFMHRRAGLPAPWPSSRALLDALEDRVPEAFAQETAGIRTPDEERHDVVQLLEWAGQRMPSAKPALEYLHRYIARGKHVGFTAIPVEERFDDRGNGAEAHTACEICGHVVTVGRHATDEECRHHRCP